MSDPLTVFPADQRGLLDGAYKRVPYHEVGQLLQEGWTILRLIDEHFHPMDRHGLMMKMPCKRITLDLPLPPSVNEFEHDKRGRPLGNRSSKVQRWIKLADAWLYGRLRGANIKGPYLIHVTWSASQFRKFDVSNRLKALEDYLERIGVIENDRECWDLHARWGDVDKDWCRVEIWPKD